MGAMIRLCWLLAWAPLWAGRSPVPGPALDRSLDSALDGCRQVSARLDGADRPANSSYRSDRVVIPAYACTGDDLAYTDPDGVTAGDDGSGRVTKSSASAKSESTLEFAYDADRRLASATRDGSVIAAYAYTGDGSDLVASYTDPNGVTASYDYDASGRVTKIDIENGPSLQYCYDQAGNLVSVASSDMETSFGAYHDALDPNHPSPLPLTMSWRDARDFAIQYTDNHLLQQVSSVDYRLSLAWDEARDLALVDSIERVAPGFSETWTPQYSADNRLTSNTITRSYVDATGTAVTQTIEEANGPGSARLPLQLARSLDGQPILGVQNQVDGIGGARIAGYIDSVQDVTGSLIYDPEDGSLVAINEPAGSWIFEYNGDREMTRAARTGDRDFETDFVYDLQHRLVSRSAPGIQGRVLYFWHGNRVIAIGHQANPVAAITCVVWGNQSAVFEVGLVWRTSAGWLAR